MANKQENPVIRIMGLVDEAAQAAIGIHPANEAGRELRQAAVLALADAKRDLRGMLDAESKGGA